MARRSKAYFARATDGNGPAATRVALERAYNTFLSTQEGQVILTDLLGFFGYYQRPTYQGWLKEYKTSAGFELHSALSNARAEVLEHIMSFLTMSDETKQALEKAARTERETRLTRG